MLSSAAPHLPRMQAFKPSPALAPYVTDIWAWELPPAAQPGTSSALTLLPDGFPTLCLVYGDALVAVHGDQAWTMRSAICGFQARPMQMSCEGFAAGLTVRFVPWGLGCFMPGSLEEAAHRRLDCRDVFPSSTIEDLESALFELPTTLARVRCVEAFLLTRLQAQSGDRLVQQVVHGITGEAGARAVREMAREAGASERTLERRFRRSIGVPPKAFSRVVRLQDALRRHDRQSSWAESAIDAGYYDQAHLIRDAQEIFGISPEAVKAALPSEVARGFQALGRDTALGSTIFR
jgi:AraC-like DNA-binding protein